MSDILERRSDGGNEIFIDTRYDRSAMTGSALPTDGSTLCGPVALPAARARAEAPVAPHVVEWVSPGNLSDSALREWQELTANAAQPNIFAEPWLALPGLLHCDVSATAQIGLVRSTAGRLVGVLPMSGGKRLGRLPLTCCGNWSHPNAFLVAAQALPGHEQALWSALLASSTGRFRGSRALAIDGLVEGSALHDGLIAAADASNLPMMVETRVTRAMLATELEAEAYWEASVRAKKRKELRRQWARLGEMGALSVDHGDAGGDPASWIGEFMALEARGWKGANRSALSSQPDTEAFFSAAMTAGWRRGQVMLTALRIDGRAVAMLITLVSGNAGFSFKTAFDEEFARFSPGVLLQRESLTLLTARKLAFIDSCAAQDHPMIDSLWRERRSVIGVSLPLPGTGNRLAWRAAQTAMAGWRGIKRWRTGTAQVEAPQSGEDQDQ